MNKYIIDKQDAKRKKLGITISRVISILAAVVIVVAFFITFPSSADTEEAIEEARRQTLTYRYAFSFLVFSILSFSVIVFNEIFGGLYHLLKVIIKLLLAGLVLVGGGLAIFLTDLHFIACQVSMIVSLAVLVYAFIPTHAEESRFGSVRQGFRLRSLPIMAV